MLVVDSTSCSFGFGDGVGMTAMTDALPAFDAQRAVAVPANVAAKLLERTVGSPLAIWGRGTLH